MYIIIKCLKHLCSLQFMHCRNHLFSLLNVVVTCAAHLPVSHHLFSDAQFCFLPQTHFAKVNASLYTLIFGAEALRMLVIVVWVKVMVADQCCWCAGASLFFPDKESKRQRLFSMMNNVDVSLLIPICFSMMNNVDVRLLTRICFSWWTMLI